MVPVERRFCTALELCSGARFALTERLAAGACGWPPDVDEVDVVAGSACCCAVAAAIQLWLCERCVCGKRRWWSTRL